MKKISVNDTITVFGGDGFIGSHIVYELAASGAKIKIVSRHPAPNHPLKIYGSVGQIVYSEGDVTSFKDVEKNIIGSTCVINLIGILNERGKQNFKALHIEAARNIALSCFNNNVERLVHFSALGVDRNSTSRYATTKREGEIQVHKQFPEAIIIRPSVVFGLEDNFINMLVSLVRILPILPLIGGGHTRFQPIYVKDVASLVHQCLRHDNMRGRILEIGGPKIYTLKEIYQLICKILHKKRIFLPIPFCLAKMQALFLELLPNPPLTRDQIALMKSDNILLEKNALLELGVIPSMMDVILPTYLK